MIPSQLYIAIAVVVLAVIALLVFLTSKDKKARKFTPLAGLAFGFILGGIIFGDNRLMGYSLMGVGVVLAVIDGIRKSKSMS